MRLSLGKRIKILRTDLKLTQAELAAAIGSTRATIANWELDRAEPDAEMLSRLSVFFRVSTDYLVGRTNNPNEPLPAQSKQQHPDIRLLSRAAERMSPEEIERLRKVAEVLFPEAFRN